MNLRLSYRLLAGAVLLLAGLSCQNSPPPEPKDTVVKTGLRSVYITTSAPVSDKVNWVGASQMKLVDDDGKCYYETHELSIKGRGNTTWAFPKKPYALKLPEKADLLGRSSSKRYVLIANWLDRSRLRNDVSYEMARRTSLEWTPSGEFVELYLNGAHQGLYWLGEQIKVEKGRVQADCLIEMDDNFDETWRFFTQYGYREGLKPGLPANVKYPDSEDITEDSFDQLRAMVSSAEKALYEGGDYAAFMDLQSFADWYLVHEVSGNMEPAHPRSCFFHFRDGKMIAGPVWDFDIGTYASTTSTLSSGRPVYFDELLKKGDFVSLLKQRWEVLKPKFSTLGEYIDAKAEEIALSEQFNEKQWPIPVTWNGDETLGFEESVGRMKASLSERISLVDQRIKQM